VSDDHVIDIRQYLDSESDGGETGTFAVWGGEGEGSRFALPLWRAIFLLGGNWGGIVSVTTDGTSEKPDEWVEPTALLIIDMKEDPARQRVPVETLSSLGKESAPALANTRAGGLAVLLGEDESRRWFLQVLGEGPLEKPDGKDLETLLFLAGECSGLLFLRELSKNFPL